VSLFLKDSWISTLRAAIRTSLRDVGRGWFNLHEANWEVYQISKLKKFMEMVKFNMQVCITFYVLSMISRTIVRQVCRLSPDVPASISVSHNLLYIYLRQH